MDNNGHIQTFYTCAFLSCIRFGTRTFHLAADRHPSRVNSIAVGVVKTNRIYFPCIVRRIILF